MVGVLISEAESRLFSRKDKKLFFVIPQCWFKLNKKIAHLNTLGVENRIGTGKPADRDRVRIECF